MAVPNAEGTVALTIGTTTLSATTVSGENEENSIICRQVSALAGLKLLGVSAGLLLARGASLARGTRRGRRSPKKVFT